MSIRKLAGELDISNGSVVRILKQDLGYRSYKKTVEPALTDFEKSKRMKGRYLLRVKNGPLSKFNFVCQILSDSVPELYFYQNYTV